MFNARKLKNAMIKLAIFKTAIFNFICKKSTIVKNNIFKIYKRKKAACAAFWESRFYADSADSVKKCRLSRRIASIIICVNISHPTQCGRTPTSRHPSSGE